MTQSDHRAAMTSRAAPALALALGLIVSLAAGCSNGGSDSADGTEGQAVGVAAVPSVSAVTAGADAGSETGSQGLDDQPSRFAGEVRGSAEQVIVTGAEPDQTLTLVGGAEPVTGARVSRNGGGATYRRIGNDGLTVEVDGELRTIPCDSVVLCAGQESVRDLESALEAAGTPVHVIGGAAHAAELDAKRAILEGVTLAARL